MPRHPPPRDLDVLAAVSPRPGGRRYCIRHKVICVPGIFFDVNPWHRRRFHKSPYLNMLRLSYGPAWPNLRAAVKGMKEIIDLAKAGKLPPLDAYSPPASPPLRMPDGSLTGPRSVKKTARL